MYGFKMETATRALNKGAYTHDLLFRGNSDLCRFMTRSSKTAKTTTKSDRLQQQHHNNNTTIINKRRSLSSLGPSKTKRREEVPACRKNKYENRETILRNKKEDNKKAPIVVSSIPKSDLVRNIMESSSSDWFSLSDHNFCSNTHHQEESFDSFMNMLHSNQIPNASTTTPLLVHTSKPIHNSSNTRTTSGATIPAPFSYDDCQYDNEFEPIPFSEEDLDDLISWKACPHPVPIVRSPPSSMIMRTMAMPAGVAEEIMTTFLSCPSS